MHLSFLSRAKKIDADDFGLNSVSCLPNAVFINFTKGFSFAMRRHGNWLLPLQRQNSEKIMSLGLLAMLSQLHAEQLPHQHLALNMLFMYSMRHRR